MSDRLRYEDVNSYDYDANGNMTTISGSPSASYTWNAENRLSSATKNSVTESYVYDVDGNRIKKTSGGVITRTFFPGHYEEEGSTPIKHYNFNGQIIATRRGTTLSYLHVDHLSSNSVSTNSSGTQTASRTYHAYGTTRSSSGTLPTDRTFTGQKQDSTGLIYLNARYYDPALGTFISPDTLVPDAGRVFDYNRFAYARLNPLKYTDPTGHLSEDEIRKYYGYNGNDKDALRRAMLDDKWGEDLVDWLLHTDTHFGDIFTYYDTSGNRVGEAILALFETSNGSYEGGFYGLSGTSKGIRVSRSQIASFKDYTDEAGKLKLAYGDAYDRLPRRVGSNGHNYYDPVLYKDYSMVDLVSVGSAVIGSVAAGFVALGCVSNPAGWLACMGGTAGVVSTGATATGTIAVAVNPPQPALYPLLRNSGRIVGNTPVWRSMFAPRGVYE